MVETNRNWLLATSLAAFSAYWLVGAQIERPYVALAAATFQFLLGLAALSRYSTDTYAVVVRGQRNPDQPGAHYAIFGIFLLGAGAVYSGAYGGLNALDYIPESWAGSVQAGFGRALTGAGFGYLVYSPDAARRGFRIGQSAWYFAMVVCAAIVLAGVMFTLGVKVGQRDPSGFDGIIYRDTKNRPVCKPNEPIWVTDDGIYHTRLSRYRPQVVKPAWCFPTEREARMAGFRPPR